VVAPCAVTEYGYEEFEAISVRTIKKLPQNVVVQISSSVWKVQYDGWTWEGITEVIAAEVRNYRGLRSPESCFR
jgi:hypothetical protein